MQVTGLVIIRCGGACTILQLATSHTTLINGWLPSSQRWRLRNGHSPGPGMECAPEGMGGGQVEVAFRGKCTWVGTGHPGPVTPAEPVQ